MAWQSLSLFQEERDALSWDLRMRKADGIELRRAGALLLFGEGNKAAWVAKILNLDLDSVHDWRRSYLELGPASIKLVEYPERADRLGSKSWPSFK